VSTTTLLLLTGFLFFTAVALTALILAARNADEGYEDQNGYHSGRRQTSRARASRLVKPLLQEQFKVMLMPDVPLSALILAPGATPKPPRMDFTADELDTAAVAAPLLPANLPVGSINLQTAVAGAEPSKRKRKSARKAAASDGNQLGFPGFAA
jgi:hypothetical protein